MVTGNSIAPGRPSRQQLNADRTRQAILEAAQEVFSTRGFGEAGIREIAARAGANAALIGRYFGSKLELFEAALDASFDVSPFTLADRESFGATIADAFCQSGHAAAAIVPMLVFSAGDSAASKSALHILERRVAAPLADWFGEPAAKEKVAQFLAVLTGFFIYRTMLPLDGAKGTPTPGMRQWLAKMIQEIADR